MTITIKLLFEKNPYGWRWVAVITDGSTQWTETYTVKYV